MPSGRQLEILRWHHAINHPPAWLTTIFIWDRCRAPSSALGIRGCRSRFAATPLRGRSDHFRCGRRRDGFLRSATKTDPLCQRRTPFRIGRRGDWVIRWQLPPDAICFLCRPRMDSAAEEPMVRRLSAGGYKDSNHRFRGGRARRFVCRFSFALTFRLAGNQPEATLNLFPAVGSWQNRRIRADAMA